MTSLHEFNPLAIVIIALLNPVVIAIGLLMGRSADQPQKIPVAGFAAALAGSVAIWIVAWLRIMPTRGSGNEAGIFVLQFLLGMGWTAIGYYVVKPRLR